MTLEKIKNLPGNTSLTMSVEGKSLVAMPVIGSIVSPFDTLENMPIQPVGAKDILGKLVVHEEYAAGLKDLEGFSHIYIFYHFHKATKTKLIVEPFMDKTPRGVFATRAPLRPSHLGMSVVELVSVDKNIIEIKGVDVLNGTPLIDIKPYILKFDYRSDATSGWLKAGQNEIDNRSSDKRFE